MDTKIIIGTSGYSYADWVGPFYPEGLKQHEFLRYYASQFAMTELNFTFYRQPEATQIKRMADFTDRNFVFAVKAHKLLTHEINCSSIDQDIILFKKGIEPLAIESKLGAVLLQFPYSFYYNDTNRRYLEKLCVSLNEFPLVVEFRNTIWQRPSVYDGLRMRKVGVVNVDEPPLEKLLKPTAIVTSEVGYVRFHGRNSAQWWDGDVVSRYDYCYSERELEEWVPRIKTIANSAKKVFIAFNNHSRGQAAQNAAMLKTMLVV